MKNKFCSLSDLRNESDVEQFFVIRLLHDLGFKDSSILTKHSVPSYVLGKGQKIHRHVPDYSVLSGRYPALLIEAKTTSDPAILEALREAQDYGAVVNRGFVG